MTLIRIRDLLRAFRAETFFNNWDSSYSSFPSLAINFKTVFINFSKPCEFHSVSFHSTYVSWYW